MRICSPTSKQADLLQNIQIAAPCPADWNAMTGDDCKRFCGDCKLNVYDISSMSEKEAIELITSSEKSVCLRLYRRKDGTVITDNCPVGLRKIRDLYKKIAVSITLSLCWLGLISSANAQSDIVMGTAGTVRVEPVPTYTPLQTIIMTTGIAVSAAAFGILCKIKRASLSQIALALMFTWFFTGVAMATFTGK